MPVDMRVIQPFQTAFNRIIKRRVDPASLSFRLTLEVTLLSGLGLVGVTVGAGWMMEQILVATHKQTVQYVAARYPDQVNLYSDMASIEVSLKMAIEKLATPEILLWVKNPDGKILAQSTSVSTSLYDLKMIDALTDMPIESEIYQVGNRYLIMCGSPLIVQGRMLGNVHVAQDVTLNQQQLNRVIRQLIVVSFLVTLALMITIAIRIRHALQPLHHISRAANAISIDDLNVAHLQVNQTPSEIRGLAQAFNMMLSRLSMAWEQQRQFVSNASHELRTPLTIIHGYLQSLLRRSSNLNAYQQEALATAAAESERTVRLLQDLLELARADNGYLSFQHEPIVLNALVAEVAGMGEKFSHRQILVTSTTSEIVVKANRDRLLQVLINLIDNAVKYSAPDQPVELMLEQTHQLAKIHVQDHGVGIPLHHQSRIFERFYRGDEDQIRSTAGTGLGLAIAKSLVEGMGGQISVRSRPGEGSLFTVTLLVWKADTSD
jgi:heavy metal sensor kinase